jgi:prolyl-tRNA editing enzyme YbaK/EbsC (Cys-tRNA(Pro) deacylase)
MAIWRAGLRVIGERWHEGPSAFVISPVQTLRNMFSTGAADIRRGRSVRLVRTMKTATAPSAIKVQAVLGERFTVLEFDAGTRTAADAAAAIGCTVAKIAKSLVFRTATSGRPALIVASGDKRVDENKAAAAVGEKIGRANADFVREATGFAIGGVPPVGHARPPIVLIDESLLRFDNIWAAAGTPNAVFRLTPVDLVALTGGLVVDVAKG